MGPWDPTRSDRLGQDGAECVSQMVRTLADRPDQGSGDELARLCEEVPLNGWHPILEDAPDRQRVIRRDATYRHPRVEQVCQTLNGGTPANAGDLAALLVDRLNELGDRLRTESTDGWSQFWNHDSYGRPTDPKPENSCRKLLQLILEPLLPAAVDLSGEGSYANNTRADLRVVFSDFEVPVEIKRGKHQQLWSAARDQLIRKYAVAAATAGYGVYLVFWFGGDGMPPPPSGAPPTGPDELKTRLEATLSVAERRKIAVVVIDVSRAGGK